MSGPSPSLPFATDLPGTGGVLRQSEEDFFVDERLAYQPAGVGDHVFVHLEKRGLTTPAAAEVMAHALGVDSRDVGWAGMKDKRAVARQTLSLPPPCTPEAVLALELPGITVLAAARHGHKLRTGHVSGNRFVLCLRELDVDEDTAAARARAVLAALAAPPGSPNFFGEQRFGVSGGNAAVGRALVLGEPLPGGMRKPHGRKLRLYISALQSELFNEYLRARMDDGLYRRVLLGDFLQKRDSGGVFACTEPDVDQARMDAGEVVPMGPMFGHKSKLAAADTDAGRRERALLDAHGLTAEAFARVGKLGMGTRRPLGVHLGETAVRALAGRAIEISFDLPAGAYATTVVREIVKTDPPHGQPDDGVRESIGEP